MRKAKQNINKHIYIYCQKENMGLKDKHTDIIVFIFFFKKGKHQQYIMENQQYIMENQQYLKHV